MADAPLFVVDDDPTGAQGQEQVPILLAWSPSLLEEALRGRPRALHLLTNSRALDGEGAFAIVRDAVAAVRACVAEPRVVLRGDSTLRGHLLPEYLALCAGLALTGEPPLLLVPALPAAGRITRDGSQWLVEQGRRTPVAETPFAADGRLGYRSSRLVDWADERSGGHFARERGVELDLDVVRSAGGAERIAEALLGAARAAEPVVVVPDAETDADLEIIAAGLRSAWEQERAIAVRCGPAFAGVLSGARSRAEVPVPRVERGLLVIVGSYVPLSSRQLAALDAARPGVVVEVSPGALSGGAAGAAADEAAQCARDLLGRERVAVVATARTVASEDLAHDVGMRVAHGIAGVVDRLRDASDVLVSKGGITSAVNVRDGLHADRAQVVGPVAPGISLWHVPDNSAAARPVIVFPGNVGDDDSLARLVDRLLA